MGYVCMYDHVCMIMCVCMYDHVYMYVCMYDHVCMYVCFICLGMCAYEHCRNRRVKFQQLILL